MSGFDGSAEEVYYWIGPAAAERGWNCAIFEGPGQRGALHVNPGLVLRPDYEAPVGAVIDYLLGRPEVDPTRLALIGYSLGGFLATRAATFEPRVKAVIADSLIVDVGAAFGAMWPRVLRASPPRVVDTAFNLLARLRPDTQWGMDHARWTMGIAHPRDFFAAWAPFTLRGTEEAMTVPLLCLLGEDEIAQTSAEVITETVQYLKGIGTDGHRLLPERDRRLQPLPNGWAFVRNRRHLHLVTEHHGRRPVEVRNPPVPHARRRRRRRSPSSSGPRFGIARRIACRLVRDCHRSDIPHVVAVLGDRPVGGELAASRGIQDRLAGPRLASRHVALTCCWQLT